MVSGLVEPARWGWTNCGTCMLCPLVLWGGAVACSVVDLLWNSCVGCHFQWECVG